MTAPRASQCRLRKAGYRVAPLRDLRRKSRHTGRSQDVASAQAVRHADITARSKALLDGAAALGAVLALRERAA
ncbi:hypothetical protein [Streptomyces sp. NPDC057623]|uniref:hypothetical protein n=1 Tax=Streptomyces sp. NPDC057623 TaxID=3346187 RepID=UPI00367F182F